MGKNKAAVLIRRGSMRGFVLTEGGMSLAKNGNLCYQGKDRQGASGLASTHDHDDVVKIKKAVETRHQRTINVWEEQLWQ